MLGRMGALALSAVLLATATQARSDVRVFSGALGSLAARVEFRVSSPGSLSVLLTNAGAADVFVPADVLTGVFWSSDAWPALVPLSATAVGDVLYWSTADDPYSSAALRGTEDGAGAVGGEWAYRSGLSRPFGPAVASHGISSTGLGLFGPMDRFPGANLDGPASPGGLEYGIVPLADLEATGNGGVTKAPLLRDGVEFQFATEGLLDLSAISGVWFQYGTSVSEPWFPGRPPVRPPTQGPNPVPEPGVAGFAGSVLLMVTGVAMRRRWA